MGSLNVDLGDVDGMATLMRWLRISAFNPTLSTKMTARVTWRIPISVWGVTTPMTCGWAMWIGTATWTRFSRARIRPGRVYTNDGSGVYADTGQQLANSVAVELGNAQANEVWLNDNACLAVCGDCDMDGDLDVIDSLLIAQFVVGLPVMLNCP